MRRSTPTERCRHLRVSSEIAEVTEQSTAPATAPFAVYPWNRRIACRAHRGIGRALRRDVKIPFTRACTCEVVRSYPGLCHGDSCARAGRQTLRHPIGGGAISLGTVKTASTPVAVLVGGTASTPAVGIMVSRYAKIAVGENVRPLPDAERSSTAPPSSEQSAATLRRLRRRRPQAPSDSSVGGYFLGGVGICGSCS